MTDGHGRSPFCRNGRGVAQQRRAALGTPACVRTGARTGLELSDTAEVSSTMWCHGHGARTRTPSHLTHAGGECGAAPTGSRAGQRVIHTSGEAPATVSRVAPNSRSQGNTVLESRLTSGTFAGSPALDWGGAGRPAKIPSCASQFGAIIQCRLRPGRRRGASPARPGKEPSPFGGERTLLLLGWEPRNPQTRGLITSIENQPSKRARQMRGSGTMDPM